MLNDGCVCVSILILISKYSIPKQSSDTMGHTVVSSLPLLAHCQVTKDMAPYFRFCGDQIAKYSKWKRPEQYDYCKEDLDEHSELLFKMQDNYEDRYEF